MKKISVIILAFILALSVCLIVACKPDDKPGDTPKTYINMRSDAQQTLNAGESMKLMFDAFVNGKKVNEVDYSSSNPKVAAVDSFGNVTGLTGGTADVTVSLKADASVKSVVKFTVLKTVFVMKPGYSQGDVDLTTADSKGWVLIKEGFQTQILASECDENWYFACTLRHMGGTGQDSSGRWGVGSFLVNDTTAIGNTMAWFGLKPTSHATKTYTPYVGGWQNGSMDPEVEVYSAIADSDKAAFEIIRYGADLYCKITVGQTVAKYVYHYPDLAGKPTYPGVYSQRQELTVSEITSTSDTDEVMAKLRSFQTAEDVVIEGVSDSLFAGDTYRLVSTVLPDTTFDKTVKYSLKQAVNGVTLTEQGVLTLTTSAVGEFTVVATAASNGEATAERTYTIKAKGTSTHNIIDTTNTVQTAADSFTLNETTVTFANGGEVYLPVMTDLTKYALSFKATLTAGKVGFVNATKGYTDYFKAVIDNGHLVYGFMTGGNTAIACSKANVYELTVIRDGDYFLFVVNGRLVNRLYGKLDGAIIPAIFTENAVGTIEELSVLTVEEDVNAEIAKYPHTVGKYVTDNGDGSYTIANMTFQGDKTDINWPPVNDYENGLKFADTLKGDFTIEFTMSDINASPVNGKYDGKVLIYLRSESKTASLQFCIKGNSGEPAVKFCPNLNDATWTEYDMPDNVNLLEGDNAIKVVKTNAGVELYINGTRVFQGNGGLNNSGYWNADTPCTPGIGTFSCGVTVSNVALTAVASK